MEGFEGCNGNGCCFWGKELERTSEDAQKVTSFTHLIPECSRTRLLRDQK